MATASGLARRARQQAVTARATRALGAQQTRQARTRQPHRGVTQRARPVTDGQMVAGSPAGVAGTYPLLSASRRRVAVAAPGGRQVQARIPSRTWHRVVLAEFVACVILVAASPVLTPRTKGKGNTAVADPAASLAGPLVRLTAVCIVFFVLALMASGPRSGKVAAAFGGLVLAGTLLNATDMFKAFAQAFGPASPAKQARQLGAGVAAGAETGLGVAP